MKKNSPTFEAIGSGATDSDFIEDRENVVEIQTDPFDWWTALVDLVAGSDHGCRIGLISSIDCELVEVLGVLPKPLRKGLRRVAPWHDRDYVIEWVPRLDGCGMRYELDGLGDLLCRLAERRKLMRSGANE